MMLRSQRATLPISTAAAYKLWIHGRMNRGLLRNQIDRAHAALDIQPHLDFGLPVGVIDPMLAFSAQSLHLDFPQPARGFCVDAHIPWQVYCRFSGAAAD